MIRLTALVIALPLMAGCTTTSTAADAAGEAECNLAAAERFIGQAASKDVGAQLLAASGARTLRWAPPRSALTMDYRPDRLTVSYDDAMIITEMTCA